MEPTITVFEQRQRAVEILRKYQALKSRDIEYAQPAAAVGLLDEMLEKLADIYDVKPAPALTYEQNAQLQDLLAQWAAANVRPDDGDLWIDIERVIENVQETLPAQPAQPAPVQPWAERTLAGEIQIRDLTLTQHAIIVNGLSCLLPNANAAWLLDAIKEVSS